MTQHQALKYVLYFNLPVFHSIGLPTAQVVGPKSTIVDADVCNGRLQDVEYLPYPNLHKRSVTLCIQPRRWWSLRRQS